MADPSIPGAPPPACERCGSFTDARVPLAGWQLCPPCVERLARGGRFWSSRYVTGIGVLLNPAASAALVALNYRRLGEARRATSWTVAAGVLVAVYVALIASNVELPPGLMVGAGIGGGFAIGRAWQPVWAQLAERGAGRASAVVPVLVTISAVVGVVVLVVLAS